MWRPSFKLPLLSRWRSQRAGAVFATAEEKTKQPIIPAPAASGSELPNSFSAPLVQPGNTCSCPCHDLPNTSISHVELGSGCLHWPYRSALRPAFSPKNLWETVRVKITRVVPRLDLQSPVHEPVILASPDANIPQTSDTSPVPSVAAENEPLADIQSAESQPTDTVPTVTQLSDTQVVDAQCKKSQLNGSSQGSSGGSNSASPSDEPAEQDSSATSPSPPTDTDKHLEDEEIDTPPTVLDDGRATYTYLGHLGQGSYASVFVARTKCKDPTLNIPEYVAIKAFEKAGLIYDYWSHDCVKTELETLQRITLAEERNEFLPSVISIFQDETHCYAVMHLCGMDMHRHLDALRHRMTTKEIIMYAAELLLAIEGCQKLGIVHRDIKPQNILIGPDGRIVLADFSIAQLAPASGNPAFKDMVMKDVAQVMATGCQAAPEQLPFGSLYGYKCDIWTYGLFVFELFMGDAKPFFKEVQDDNFPGEAEITSLDLLSDIETFVDTKEAKDLLKKILVRDPEQRLDIDAIKAHPLWDDLDEFTWEKPTRGQYLATFCPPFPKGDSAIVWNVHKDGNPKATHPETAPVDTAGASVKPRDFTDPVFEFRCPAEMLATDPRNNPEWAGLPRENDVTEDEATEDDEAADDEAEDDETELFPDSLFGL